MSSNSFASIEHLITCDLCSKQYDDPRLLPCSHTYCFNCINKIISTNKHYFQCPSCIGIEITQNDIDTLPSNRMILDIIELNTLMQRSIMCSNCEKSPAVYICDTCSSDYCLECFQTIHAARALRNHRKTSIDKKISGILLCQKHGDEKLKYWCQQCQIPVCSDCLLIEHKDHTYNSIDKSSKDLETKIEKDLEIIELSLNNKIKQADTLLTSIDVNSQSNKTEIVKTMMFLRQIIDEHEKQMLQDVENFQREENQLIEEYKIKLENQLKYFNLQNKNLKLIISVNDQIRLLKNKSEFFNYIYQTTEILEKLQIPIRIDYHISGIEQLQDIKEQILQCARVIQTPKQIMQIFTDEKSEIDKFIAQYQSNQEVDLNKKSLTDQNIPIIVEILKKNTKMITLNLSNNQIGHEGIQQLTDVLKDNKILTTLDLSNNQISDDGTKHLANILKTNSTLTTLYLNDNEITNQGTKYLTDALKNNITLTVLDLQSNQISYLGAQQLAEALRGNYTLTTLYLSNNQIGNEGAQYLADALQQNKTLTMLILTDNQIDYKAKRRVIETLKTNTRVAVYW